MNKDVNVKRGMNGGSGLKKQKSEDKPDDDDFGNDIEIMEAELYHWLIMSAYPAADSRQTKKSKTKKINNHKLNKNKK